jgi:hypothetical protein
VRVYSPADESSYLSIWERGDCIEYALTMEIRLAGLKARRISLCLFNSLH